MFKNFSKKESLQTFLKVTCGIAHPYLQWKGIPKLGGGGGGWGAHIENALNPYDF